MKWVGVPEHARARVCVCVRACVGVSNSYASVFNLPPTKDLHKLGRASSKVAKSKQLAASDAQETHSDFVVQ